MAISVRTPTGTITARTGQIYLAASHEVAISASTTLSGAFASVTSGVAISAGVTNLTITPPETGYDKVDFLGQDTGGFQNQVLDQKPVGTAALSATLLVNSDELIEDKIVSGLATGVVVGAIGYSRYQIGKAEPIVAVCATFIKPDTSKQQSYLLKDARVSKWGDLKLAADGHLEQDIAFICLAKDFYYEFKD